MQIAIVEMLFAAVVAFGLGWTVAHKHQWTPGRALAGLLIAVLAAMLIGVRTDVGVIGGVMMGGGFVFRRGFLA